VFVLVTAVTIERIPALIVASTSIAGES
jgi:hypothetical protein